MKSGFSNPQKARLGEYSDFCLNFEGKEEHRWDVINSGRGIIPKGKLCFCGKARYVKHDLHKWKWGWPIVSYHLGLESQMEVF